MTYRLLDTNFIVRHLMQDNPAQADIANRFFRAADRAEVKGVILLPVLAECVYVLLSFYKVPRLLIESQLALVLTSPNILIDAQPICLDALKRFATTKYHFIDCLLAATAAAEGYAVATFDSDFRRFTDVRVELD